MPLSRSDCHITAYRWYGKGGLNVLFPEFERRPSSSLRRQPTRRSHMTWLRLSAKPEESDRRGRQEYSSNRPVAASREHDDAGQDGKEAENLDEDTSRLREERLSRLGHWSSTVRARVRTRGNLTFAIFALKCGHFQCPRFYRRRLTDRPLVASNSADRPRPCDPSMPLGGTQGQLNRAVDGPLQRLVKRRACSHWPSLPPSRNLGNHRGTLRQ